MPLSPKITSARWFRIGQWFLLPIIGLLLFEVYVRERFTSRPRWYEDAEQRAMAHPINYLFVGSSRVAAAIDTPTFEKVMSQRLGQPVRALNLGLAWSTPVEHYFGLRRLFQTAPDHLAGCVVFWEAPGKTLNLGNWNGPWVNPERPQLILQVLRTRELNELWKSPATIDTKLSLSIKMLMRPSALFSMRERVRERIVQRGESAFAWLLNRHQPAAARSKIADLTTEGGIRVDEVGVANIQALALPVTETAIRNQRRCDDWNSEVYNDIRQLVEQHHGRIVLFDMPESTVFQRVYQTPIGQHNQQTFREQMGRLHTVLLQPAFAYNDDDFPDLWHLRKSRAPELTTALAQSYLQATGTQSIP